jgi:hypothetical protein
MKNFSAMLLAAVFGLSANAAIYADWSTGMQGGGTVTVDPDTGRATVTEDGMTVPLWNGVHRLQDGSVLIIHHGEVVPREATGEPHQLSPPETTEWEGMPIVGYSPCEQLTRRVCGREDECATAAACNPSRQLLAMEEEERSQAHSRSRMTYTSGQCLEALQDTEFFTACRPGK